MSPILFSLAISGVVLVLLVSLFSIEKRRGARFFPRMRGMLDRGTEAFYRGFFRVAQLLGRDVVRHTAHYLFHRVLEWLRNVFRGLEQKTDRLLRVNKELAKRAIKKEKNAPIRTGLQEVVDHKADIALTPKERRVRKEKSIGTKL